MSRIRALLMRAALCGRCVRFPGVPGVGGFVLEAAGDADGALGDEFRCFHGQADLACGEFTGLEHRVRRRWFCWSVMISFVGCFPGVTEFHHQRRLPGLGTPENPVGRADLVDKPGRPIRTPVAVDFPHTQELTTGVRQSLCDRGG